MVTMGRGDPVAKEFGKGSQDHFGRLEIQAGRARQFSNPISQGHQVLLGHTAQPSWDSS